MSSYVEATEAFKNAMLDGVGYAPENIIGDGHIQRVKDQHGKLNGAYILHLDKHPAGYFEDFKQGIKVRWKFAGDFKIFTGADRKTFTIERKRQTELRQAEEKAKHDAAKRKAAYIWTQSNPAPASHPYLIKKHIHPHGARLGRDGRLIIPVQNSDRELVNLQFINETGEKRFLYGGLKKGCFHILGSETGTILICEGFATGASLFEATGNLTVIAFDAGNLKAVAIVIKSLYPNAEIVICGDNDVSGIGQKAAIDAAIAINGKYIIPATSGQDWNDSLTMEIAQ